MLMWCKFDSTIIKCEILNVVTQKYYIVIIELQKHLLLLYTAYTLLVCVCVCVCVSESVCVCESVRNRPNCCQKQGFKYPSLA